MSEPIDTRIVAFIASLVRACKRCPLKGATCPTCAIYGAESLYSDIMIQARPLSIGKSEPQKRRDAILRMLAAGPLPAKDIRLDCTKDLKYATLRMMSHDGEVEFVRRGGKQNIYRLPQGKNTKTEGTK